MITFMGYRFVVREKGEWGDYEFVALDPDTPLDVVEALYKTARQNVLCYLKRFSPSSPSR